MPIRSPGYNVPTFPPTGTPEVDEALTAWAGQFGAQYTETQQTLERLPAVYTTFRNTTGATNPQANYLSKRVTLQGGEQVVVVGYFDLEVSAGGAMTTVVNTISQVAHGLLKVRYPGGTTESFTSNQSATLRTRIDLKGTSEGGVQRTTVTNRQNASWTWPIEARFQNGGEHTFTLHTNGDGYLFGAQLTVQVF